MKVDEPALGNKTRNPHCTIENLFYCLLLPSPLAIGSVGDEKSRKFSTANVCPLEKDKRDRKTFVNRLRI